MTPSNYVTIPLRRGVFEIREVITLTQQIGGYIMGGYPRYMASVRSRLIPAKDLDVFTNSEENMAAFRSAFSSLEIKFENDTCVCYKIPTEGPFASCPSIQLIKPKVEGAIVTTGTVEEILNNFDFTITRIAIAPDGVSAIADEEFLKDEKSGILRLKNIHCPISSLLRAMKYGRKGFYMRPAEAMKLFRDWTERTEDYRTFVIESLIKSQAHSITPEEITELYKLLKVD